MKHCRNCPLLEDCRQILNVDEQTAMTEDCPIFDQVAYNFINQLIQKISEVVVKARQNRQD